MHEDAVVIRAVVVGTGGSRLTRRRRRLTRRRRLSCRLLSLLCFDSLLARGDSETKTVPYVLYECLYEYEYEYEYSNKVKAEIKVSLAYS
jgi:hypothetical protein